MPQKVNSVKKKFEFSKILVTWAMGITTLCILASFILSLLSCDTCSDITTTVIGTCVAIAVSYEAKSFGEKNSRNKFGLGDDGAPLYGGYGQDTEEDEEALG